MPSAAPRSGAQHAQTLKLRDARVLGFAEYGASDGHPVLAFHGVPGTRLMWRPADAIARHHGLRLIAPDRPGFGLSTPKPGRTLADWVSDISELAAHLGLDRFAVAGISGGGPYATATAASLGERVSALALISPMGPVRSLHGQVPIDLVDRLFFLRLPRRPRVVGTAIGIGNGLFRWAPEFYYDLFVRALPPADREIMREPRLRQQVIEDVLESLKQDGDGSRSDLRIFSEAWDVDFSAITAPATLWQGLADTIVPIQVSLELGALIPDCRVNTIPNAGHFWVYRNFETIMETIAGAVAPGAS